MQIAMLSDPRRPLVEEVIWAASHGFEVLDITLTAPYAALAETDWAAVRSALGDHGLGVVCRAAPDLPVENASPLVRQAALNELRRSLDVAAQLAAPICTTSFRGWPDHLDERSGYEYTRQLYEVACAHGKALSVRLALENRPQNTHQLKWFREIFQRLPDLGLCYNVGHGNIQTMQSMTREYLFALADRLAHVRISDNDGRENSQLAFGAPRRGGINLARELQSLRSFRYDAAITVAVLGERRWLLASAEILRAAWPQAA